MVIEYSGVLEVNSLDQTSAATGTSTSAVTGTTVPTSQADELWIGGIGIADGRRTLNSPFGNAFALVASPKSGSTSTDSMIYALEKIVSATGTASSSGTLSTSDSWSGTLSTFRTVTPTNLALAGSAASNYTLVGASGSVLITPRPVTVTAVATTKIYDGTSFASDTPIIAPPLVSGDTTTALSQSFQNSDAGASNKVIVPSVIINDGNAGANYAVTLVNNNTGTIAQAAASLDLTRLTQTYDGMPKPVNATTTPVGLAVSITYDGSATPPSNSGSYPVIATIADSNYQGTTSTTLVIDKATALIDLAGLSQIYDGAPKPITATAAPVVSAVMITYEGSPEAPTSAGTYAVIATIADPNYQGIITSSLIIAPGNDFTSWQNLRFSEVDRLAGLADETADPDADDWPNLAEYALGSDPHQFTPALIATHYENGLSLTFTRPTGLPSVTYGAESSDNFGTWTPVPLELLSTGPIETLRARDPLTTGNPAQRFLRLRFGRQSSIQSN